MSYFYKLAMQPTSEVMKQKKKMLVNIQLAIPTLGNYFKGEIKVTVH